MRVRTELADVADYLLDDVNEDSLVDAFVQGIGNIQLLLLSAIQIKEVDYYLFCEVEDSIPIVDEEDTLHLIILKKVGENGLISLQSLEEFETAQNEFYCMLLADSHILDSEPMAMPVVSGVQTESTEMPVAEDAAVETHNADRSNVTHSESGMSEIEILLKKISDSQYVQTATGAVAQEGNTQEGNTELEGVGGNFVKAPPSEHHSVTDDDDGDYF